MSATSSWWFNGQAAPHHEIVNRHGLSREAITSRCNSRNRQVGDLSRPPTGELTNATLSNPPTGRLGIIHASLQANRPVAGYQNPPTGRLGISSRQPTGES